MEPEPHSDSSLSLHPSQFSESGDLLELSSQLDDVAGRFKKMVVDCVKVDKARMAAAHARDAARTEERHEAEKLELSRQRDECREYWYKNKELSEAQHRALVHRAESFAYAAAARPHSVWRHSPELLRRAYDESAYYRAGLKRNAFAAWRRFSGEQRQRASLDSLLAQKNAWRAKKEVFSAWRVQAARGAAGAREERFKHAVQTEWAGVVNDHEAEVSDLRVQLETMKQMLQTETQHRGALEERLKVAFMRGVCALNLEAMQVMKAEEGGAAADEAPPSAAAPTAAGLDGSLLSGGGGHRHHQQQQHATHPPASATVVSVSSAPQPPLVRAPTVEAVPRGANSAIVPGRGGGVSAASGAKQHRATPAAKVTPRAALSGYSIGGGSSVTRSLQTAVTVKEMQTHKRY